MIWPMGDVLYPILVFFTIALTGGATWGWKNTNFGDFAHGHLVVKFWTKSFAYL